jgi:hypothetical protein
MHISRVSRGDRPCYVVLLITSFEMKPFYCVTGKQCFFVLRQQQETVQCLAFVREKVSRQMVKFCAQ